MAPRVATAPQEEGEEETAELEAEEDAAGGAEPASVATSGEAAQRAKAARLGKKLRRKTVLKEQPPA
jgi:hypothetical protein